MANPEHLEILKRGVAEWNKWREENPDIELDLEKISLRAANLMCVNLRWANLNGADLIGANLSGADLYEANLNMADLYDANLNGADLQGANLNEASLGRAKLKVANLKGTELIGANLEGADLRGANLEGAKLKKAGLQRAKLKKAKFNRANLYSAYLQWTNLNGADLQGAKLERANLFGADLRGANLNEANLGRAKLNRANLNEANLGRAKLFRADLRGTDLRGAKLEGANLFGADLMDAKLEKAKLEGVNFRNARLYQTRFSSRSALDHLAEPLAPEQEAGAIFEDEEEYHRARSEKDSYKTDAPIPRLHLKFDCPEMTPLEMSLVLAVLQTTMNRIQYLVTTEDDDETISQNIIGLCTPKNYADSIRVLQVQSGSWEVVLGYLKEVIPPKWLKVIVISGILLYPVDKGADIYSKILDTRLKELQIEKLEKELHPNLPAPQQTLPPDTWGGDPTPIPLDEIEKYLEIPDEVRAELGKRTKFAHKAIEPIFRLRSKQRRYGFGPLEVETLDVEEYKKWLKENDPNKS